MAVGHLGRIDPTSAVEQHRRHLHVARLNGNMEGVVPVGSEELRVHPSLKQHRQTAVTLTLDGGFNGHMKCRDPAVHVLLVQKS